MEAQIVDKNISNGKVGKFQCIKLNKGTSNQTHTELHLVNLTNNPRGRDVRALEDKYLRKNQLKNQLTVPREK